MTSHLAYFLSEGHFT